MADLSSDALIQTLFDTLNNIKDTGSRQDIAERCLLALFDLIHTASPSLSVPPHVYNAILKTMLDLHDQETTTGKNKPSTTQQIAAGLLHEAARFLMRKNELGGKDMTMKEAAVEIAKHLNKSRGNRSFTVNKIYNKIRTTQQHVIPGREIRSDVEFEAAIKAIINFSNPT